MTIMKTKARNAECRVECCVFGSGLQYSYIDIRKYPCVDPQPHNVEHEGHNEEDEQELDVVFVEVVEEEDGEDPEDAQDVQEVVLVEHQHQLYQKHCTPDYQGYSQV